MSTIQRKCLCKSEHVTTYFIWIFTQMYHRKLWKNRIVSDIHVSDSNTFFHLHNTVSTAYTSTTNVMFWNFFSSFKKNWKSHHIYDFHTMKLSFYWILCAFPFFFPTYFVSLLERKTFILRCYVATDFLQWSKVSPKVESQSTQNFNVDKRLQWTSTWKIRIGFTPRFRLSHLFV